MQLKDHLLKLASLSEIESKIFKAKSQLETLQSHLRGLEEQLQQTQVSLAQKTKLCPMPLAQDAQVAVLEATRAVILENPPLHRWWAQASNGCRHCKPLANTPPDSNHTPRPPAGQTLG